MMMRTRVVIASVAFLAAAGAVAAVAPKSVMFGNTPSRNMVSSEKGLPVRWDLASGMNIKWSAELGSQTYAGPVLLDGKVYVGTNNQQEYNPKLTRDRGNIMAFDAETGKFIWQSSSFSRKSSQGHLASLCS